MQTHGPDTGGQQSRTQGTNTVHRKNFPLLDTDPDGWDVFSHVSVNSGLSANEVKKEINTNQKVI